MRHTLVAAILLTLLVSGCAAPPPPPNHEMVRTELFLGLSRANAPRVSDEAFTRFLDEVVTARFPEGYTVLEAAGRWRGADQTTITEPSRVVIFLHPRGRDVDAKLEEIRRLYKRRFNQEAVLRTDERTAASF